MGTISKDLYFVALLPPAASCGGLMAIKQHFADRYGAKAALRSPPHITLHMPFQFRAAHEATLHQVLAGYAAGCQPCPLTLHGFGAFAPKVIYIHVDHSPCLHDMQGGLLREMRRALYLFNGNYKDKPFKPHLTVAFRDLKKAAFAQAWAEFEQKDYHLAFMAQAITLLKHDGHRWHTYRQYPIGLAAQR